MAKTLTQIAGYEAMMGVVERIKAGLPADILPSGFFTTTRGIEGAQGAYWRVDGTRTVARQAAYGSPSRRANLQGVTKVPVTLIHSIEHILHEVATFAQLTDWENPRRQQLGQDEIDRQSGEFFRLFRNLRTSAVFSALTLGAIYFDGNGNLLPSSTGAVVSVDFGIPAGNKDQLDILGDGAIIGASWATAATDIIGDLRAVKTQMRKLGGWVPKYAFYGDNIPGYLLGNTAFGKIMQSDSFAASQLRAGVIPDGTGGFNWRPLGEAFFVDQDGTTQSWCGGDTVVFAPEPSADWWEIIEGTYPVPTDLGVVTRDAAGMTANVTEERGFASWCSMNDDPVTIKQLAKDDFLPIIKAPYAIAIAEVTP